MSFKFNPLGFSGFSMQPSAGLDGDKGWSPVLAVITDGERQVLQVTDWVGGAGTKPPIGEYIGITGLTPNIAEAQDIRGAQGPEGPVGPEGPTGVVAADSPVTYDSLTQTVGITQADPTTDGYLSSSDFDSFANKANTITGSGPISVTEPVTPLDYEVSISQADSTTDGYLSSTDWNTFNDKVSSVSKLGETALTGDITLSAGSNITLSQTGQNIEINSTASGGGVAFLKGTTAPDSSLGSDGDLYLDDYKGNLYGPKTAGSWGDPTPLRESEKELTLVYNNDILPIEANKIVAYSNGYKTIGAAIGELNDGFTSNTAPGISGGNQTVNRILTLSNNKVVVTGSFQSFAGSFTSGVVVLNEDGTRHSLPTVPYFEPEKSFRDSSGNIYFYAGYSLTNGVTQRIVKMTPSGGFRSITLDTSSSIYGVSEYYCCTIDSDGNFLVVSSDGATPVLIKFSSTGALLTELVITSSSSANYNHCYGMVIDPTGQFLVISNSESQIIEKIQISSGNATLLAGQVFVAGSDDGTGAAASFNNPRGICVSSTGDYFVADGYNHAIRKITASGVVTTLAGDKGFFGNVDGVGSLALFHEPSAIDIDASDLIYVFDSNNYILRTVDQTGLVTTIAGTGFPGRVDGIGLSAEFTNAVSEGVFIYDYKHSGSLDVLSNRFVVVDYDFSSVKIRPVDLSSLEVTSKDPSQIAAGFIDPFSVSGLNAAETASGDIILVGDFSGFAGNINYSTVVKFNQLGELDSLFDANLKSTGDGSGFDNAVRAVGIKPDGKIVLGGNFNLLNGNSPAYLVQLNADGTPDSTFNLNQGLGFDGDITRLAVQPDGKIIVAGSFFSFDGNPCEVVARLNSDGTFDPTFTSNLSATWLNQNVGRILYHDSKIYLVGDLQGNLGGVETATGIVRLNDDGTQDTTFTSNLKGGGSTAQFDGFVTDITITDSGKIWVIGDFNFYSLDSDSYTASGIFGFNSDGTVNQEAVNLASVANLAFNSFTVEKLNNTLLIGGSMANYRGVPSNLGIINIYEQNDVDVKFVPYVALSNNQQYRIVGVTAESIAPNSYGTVVKRGFINDPNVLAIGSSAGEMVYATNSDLTNIDPSSNFSLHDPVIPMGVHLGNGNVYIDTSRFLSQIKELVDVSVSLPAIGQALTWTSANIWQNNYPSSTSTLIQVRNQTGGPLSKGSVVYVSGVNSTLDLPLVDLAQADSLVTSHDTVGILTETISDNSNGYLITQGPLRMNTVGFVQGDQLFLSDTVAGGYRTTAPAGPNSKIFCALVIDGNSTDGAVYVLMQRSVHLDRLNNVEINNASLTDGQVLTYNSGTMRWENQTPSGGGGVTQIVAGTNITISPEGGTGVVTINASGGGGGGGVVGAVVTATGGDYFEIASEDQTGATATDVGFTITPKGNGALTVSLPDGTTTGGNTRGARAVDLQQTRSNSAQVASGTDSFVAGTLSRATGNSTTAIGYTTNASGSYSTAVGSFTTASGSQSVAVGYQATSIGFGAVSVGAGGTASGDRSVALLGTIYQERALAFAKRGLVADYHNVLMDANTSSSIPTKTFTSGVNQATSPALSNQIRIKNYVSYMSTAVDYTIIEGIVSVRNNQEITVGNERLKIWKVQAMAICSRNYDGSINNIYIVGTPTKTVIYDSGTWGTTDFTIDIHTLSGTPCFKIDAVQDTVAANYLCLWLANLNVYAGA